LRKSTSIDYNKKKKEIWNEGRNKGNVNRKDGMGNKSKKRKEAIERINSSVEIWHSCELNLVHLSTTVTVLSTATTNNGGGSNKTTTTMEVIHTL
jgi:hypothetical protein